MNITNFPIYEELPEGYFQIIKVDNQPKDPKEIKPQEGNG